MKTKKTKILCTLGPASFDSKVIKRLEDLGVDLFRINLSHTKIKDLDTIIKEIQRITSVPLCLDTEGAQVRSGEFMSTDLVLSENTLVRACHRSVPGTQTHFNFTPRDILDKIEIGDFISIDFNSVLVQVIRREDQDLVMRVINGGKIGKNKAITVERDIDLPALSPKDLKALEIGLANGLSHFALSFANKKEDVQKIRHIVGPSSYVISKIESLAGLKNLFSITDQSDALLIDRGDLSRQVPLEQIPVVQKSIIKTANKNKTPVFVATNLLESMVTHPAPTRAEVNDIYNTIKDGANGLVLAAETAIGLHPVACVSMVRKMIAQSEREEKNVNFAFPADTISLLVDPHGGQLIQRYNNKIEKEWVNQLRSINVSTMSLLDCEQIAHGTYSPLKGFMDSDTLRTVLNENRLPGGTIWPMPILLPISKDPAPKIETGETAALKGPDGKIYAIIKISEIFEYDAQNLVEKWFTTKSRSHPGVCNVLRGGSFFVAGEIQLIKRLPTSQKHYELTPAQCRFIFSRKGWSKVVGFHTRNPVHRGHEYIQKKALQMSGADGLFINPISGPKQTGDFKHEHVMKSYQTMLEFGYYAKGQVVLGSFPTYPRYAGPREAVFTAICRKNMGCSHFIVGRDHAGVGNFYPPDANQDFFSQLGDIGIEPMFFSPVSYDPISGEYKEGGKEDNLVSISGTKIRQYLSSGKKLEDWIMHETIQEALFEITPKNESMFLEGKETKELKI